MHIYLLRHGIAADSGPRTPDAKRELTDEGRKKLTSVLRLAKRAGAKPELVISSPLVRAVQTGELAREVLGVEVPLQKLDVLVPHGNPRNVWEELKGLRNLDGLLLAGHEPLLSHLAAYLLSAPGLRVQMKRAGLVCVELEEFKGDPHGTLKWMATPKLGH